MRGKKTKALRKLNQGGTMTEPGTGKRTQPIQPEQISPEDVEFGITILKLKDGKVVLTNIPDDNPNLAADLLCRAVGIAVRHYAAIDPAKTRKHIIAPPIGMMAPGNKLKA
jgi:hypothetical protein